MVRIAIAYDFDGTLASGNLPEHGLLRDLGIDHEAFWLEVKDFTRRHDADEVLAYMHLLLAKAEARGIALTRSRLAAYADRIPFFKGVPAWFSRINEFARAHGMEIDHFIISSGISEMIEASAIAKEFRFIFASRYFYDEGGRATGPSVSINSTAKTQFLFRINKGIFNYHDGESLNKWIRMDKRPYPFARMIYLGDGDTDIPAMKTARSQGGYSIAVFDEEKWYDPGQQGRVYKLIAEDRAQYVAPADYSEGSQLDVVVKGIIGKIEKETA
jgi:phosphoserine phosphatase